ncbi:hypothetical protein APHCR_0251 [Anaplasma phagocytophilum str. CR1007]|nr:hypothetical protein APHCR_0251 [Anaplasma phagocytophilum str. CR1007]
MCWSKAWGFPLHSKRTYLESGNRKRLSRLCTCFAYTEEVKKSRIGGFY